MKITIRATPGAKKSALLGWEDHPNCPTPVLRVKIAAPPIDGKANKALIAYLASCLQVRKSDIALLQGESARLKIVEIPDDAAERLDTLTKQVE